MNRKCKKCGEQVKKGNEAWWQELGLVCQRCFSVLKWRGKSKEIRMLGLRFIVALGGLF